MVFVLIEVSRLPLLSSISCVRVGKVLSRPVTTLKLTTEVLLIISILSGKWPLVRRWKR